MFGAARTHELRPDLAVTGPPRGGLDVGSADRTNASFDFHVEDRSDHSPTRGTRCSVRRERMSFDLTSPSLVPHVGDSMLGPPTAPTRASISTWKIGLTTPPRGGLDVRCGANA